MTTVRSVVQPGWIEVTGPGVHAVVAAADRHAEALGAAAADGLLPLLEALTAHGISAAPDFVVAAPGDAGGVRVLVRGSGSVVLPDGTRVGSDGRMPWADVDVDAAAAGDEVSVEAPAPEVPRGWRRPARLTRAACRERGARGPGGPTGRRREPRPPGRPRTPGRRRRLAMTVPSSDQLVDAGTAGQARGQKPARPEPARRGEPARTAEPARARPRSGSRHRPRSGSRRRPSPTSRSRRPTTPPACPRWRGSRHPRPARRPHRRGAVAPLRRDRARRRTAAASHGGPARHPGAPGAAGRPTPDPTAASRADPRPPRPRPRPADAEPRRRRSTPCPT